MRSILTKYLRWQRERRRGSGGHGSRFRPRLEPLEERALLTDCPTLTLSGTFNMTSVSGQPGADLRTILGHDNGWAVTLRNVRYERFDVGAAEWNTRVYAGSFQFAFSGIDAALLNDVFGRHFTEGGISGGFFQATHSVLDGDYWFFSIRPPNAGRSPSPT